MHKINIAGRGIFIIREYLPSDMSRVLALWKIAFGKEMSPLLWQWKYHDNPLGWRILLCVNEANQPVVMYGGIPYRAGWCGSTVEMIHLTDIMSHPDYRKTGLFVETGRAFFNRFTTPRRCPLLYGFPGRYHFDIGRKYLIYDQISPGIVYLRAALPRLTGMASKHGGTIIPVSADDQALDNLWVSVKNSYPISIQRDATFALWRYGNHPMNRYELWGYRPEHEDVMRACLVLKVEANRAVIVDWMMPDSRTILENVLGCLAQNLSSRGIADLETWLPDNHFISRHIRTLGFESLPEPIGIIPTARIFSPSMSFESLCENMYYTMADGDLF